MILIKNITEKFNFFGIFFELFYISGFYPENQKIFFLIPGYL